MPLNKLQKEAVEYLEGPLLVLAGPGTGKTQLLSSKVKYILENTDANPENILCLTFTDSGADNMRERLSSMIGAAAGKVNIHTYHSFGSDILAEYKNYATEFDRNLESSIDTVTQCKIIKEIQQKLPTFDILKKANTKDIINTIVAAKSARLSSEDLAKIAEDNLEVTKEINPKLNECLQNYQRGMKFEAGVKAIYLPMMEVFGEYTKKEPIVGDIERETNTLLKQLDTIYETELAKEKPSISPFTTWKNKRFELDEDGNYRLKNRVSNLKLQSLAGVMKAYEDYLQDSALFDFADMIQQAIKILQEDKGFQATLEERYQYVLLDEFQDTNAAQAKLIELLTDYENPIIMAVGDDDQAIFAFQGADTSNFLNFQNRYNAKVITLLENYRSNSEVLDFSYQVREQVEDSFAKKNKIVKKLSAFRKGGAKIARHEFLEASAEYNWVAGKINDLIKSGVKQSDIAIITPKHKYVLPLLPYLKSYENINIAYEKRDNVFEDPRIHEILTLAEFVYALSQNQNPAHQLLEILAFPFFEIPMLTAISAVQGEYGKSKNALDYLIESKDEKLQWTAKFLAELVRVSYETPVELFIDYLIGASELESPEKDADGEPLKYRSNFLNYYAKDESNYATFELYENLNVLREALRAHNNGKEVQKLKDLIQFVKDYQEAEESLVSTSPYRDSADAVQILTGHKSKGLEFEYVFIIATDDRAWGNAKGNNNFLVLPQNMAEIRHTGNTEDERLRLFFVAITRAKSNLIMTNSLQDFAGKKAARLQYLNEREDVETHAIISPYLPVSNQLVEQHFELLPKDMEKSNLRAAWVSNYQKLDGELRPILEKRLENYRLTPTDLTNFIDVAYGGPAEFFKEKVLRSPEESYSESLSFGNLMHATFEEVTNSGISDEDAVKFFKEKTIASPIPPEDLENMLEKGEESLRTSLKKFSKILRAENSHAEVNLYQEHLSLNGIPITGKIDHINIDEKAKTIEVYDFKTSGFKDKKWGQHPTLYKYCLQLGFYKLLLNLSPVYSKYKVEKAHILFVVPDSADMQVHDKVYEYNDKDEAELKALIPAVYHQIKTLDFVDNKELFDLQPDSTKGIKEIREFIKLVLDLEAQK